MKIVYGKEYYFWDKKRECVGCLKVVDVMGSYFSFLYRGKLFSCEYSYAQDRLYENKYNVKRPPAPPTEDELRYQEWYQYNFENDKEEPLPDEYEEEVNDYGFPIYEDDPLEDGPPASFFEDK